MVFAYHFLRDLLCENMRANILNENLYQNLTTQKNDTTITHKYTAMHRLPSASIVPRGFPEGRSCGTLGVDGRRCMGAVRRPSLSLRLAQHPPGVLRRTLGRVSADTANSMMNEGGRVCNTYAPYRFLWAPYRFLLGASESNTLGIIWGNAR